MPKQAAGIVSLDCSWEQKSMLLNVVSGEKGLYVTIEEADWPPMVMRSLIFTD